MGILFDAAIAGGLMKVKPKPVSNIKGKIRGSINIRNNFAIFGGASSPYNESRAIEALNRKIDLCCSANHPTVILSSDIEQVHRILSVYPNIAAFGINMSYQPFRIGSSEMEVRYTLEGIIDFYFSENAELQNSIRGRNKDRDIIVNLFIILVSIIIDSYGREEVSFNNFEHMMDNLLNANSLRAFINWVKDCRGRVTQSNINQLNMIWESMGVITPFWSTMKQQFALYRRANRVSTVIDVLRTRRPIALFYFNEIESDLVRAAVFRDLTHISLLQFPFCLISNNVPLPTCDAKKIFIPRGDNSVEFGLYYHDSYRFGTGISTIAPLLDDLICMGVHTSEDASMIANQFNYMVDKWNPHFGHKGIGVAKVQVPKIEPNLLLSNENGIPDGSTFIFSKDNMQLLHSYGITG